MKTIEKKKISAQRPVCPKCGKVFRGSGKGYRWHLENRPNCDRDTKPGGRYS
jgi:ribosomal protein S27AE